MASEKVIPKAGDQFSREDFDNLLEAIGSRQHNFPDEPAAMSMALVFFNFGEKYAEVKCSGGEWEGLKKDLPPSLGIPMCPNGHSCYQGKTLRLGWVEAE